MEKLWRRGIEEYGVTYANLKLNVIINCYEGERSHRDTGNHNIHCSSAKPYSLLCFT
ncbi:hypothetical protein D1T48_gp10 [Thermoproteus tenax virus 1]|uniref:Uncharacterized 6.5 kDa protein n=1 Tax=Thermoproteus tenax virus 1 (strain KRA1) TaxID=10480 RepID=YOR7_TTV1K|nr:hypothetical protein D1T48_gp10 [Thermoproteus tenax virus 1]P19282.1 RecName: Full=Uncharacterized 6.5 kDa protein [Thermoproteus tenax virus 1 (STRAIN KRA1)]CAA32976.1 unnamed protein product [Thermoproteus tenax virus 1]